MGQGIDTLNESNNLCDNDIHFLLWYQNDCFIIKTLGVRIGDYFDEMIYHTLGDYDLSNEKPNIEVNNEIQGFTSNLNDFEFIWHDTETDILIIYRNEKLQILTQFSLKLNSQSLYTLKSNNNMFIQCDNACKNKISGSPKEFGLVNSTKPFEYIFFVPALFHSIRNILRKSKL